MRQLRSCLCVAVIGLGMTGYASAATIFSDDFSNTNLGGRYTINNDADTVNSTTTFTVNGSNQLQIYDTRGVWGGTPSMTSTTPLNLPGGGIMGAVQILGGVNNGASAESVTLQLGNKVLLQYSRFPNGASNTGATNYGQENVSLFVDTTNGVLTSGGLPDAAKRVWQSFQWPAGGLVPTNGYIAFRMDENSWELLKSTDGVHYQTLYIKPVNGANSSSKGTFGTAQSTSFSAPVIIGVPNGHAGASGATLNIDNVTISTVPEPGSLGLLGLTGLMALRRRRTPARR